MRYGRGINLINFMAQTYDEWLAEQNRTGGYFTSLSADIGNFARGAQGGRLDEGAVNPQAIAQDVYQNYISKGLSAPSNSEILQQYVRPWIDQNAGTLGQSAYSKALATNPTYRSSVGLLLGSAYSPFTGQATVQGAAPELASHDIGLTGQAAVQNTQANPTATPQNAPGATNQPQPAQTGVQAPNTPQNAPQGATGQPGAPLASQVAPTLGLNAEFVRNSQTGQIAQVVPGGLKGFGTLQEFQQASQGFTGDVKELSPEDFQLYSQGQRPAGQAPISGTGISKVDETGAVKPIGPKDFIQTYSDIIKQLGLPDIKSEFEKVQKSYADLQNELNDKITNVNDNPWLSEGLRQKEINKLNDRYEGKLKVLTSKMDIYDSLYKEGLQEAHFLATGEYNQQQDAAQLAEKKAEAAAKLLEFDPSNFKEVQGGLFDVKNQKWIIPPKEGGAGLTNVQIDNARAVSASFENSPIVKNFIEIQSKYLNAQQYTGRGDGATDIATIYDLMKVLDPTSVVRNEEYATGAAKSGNIFAGALARFNGSIDPKGGFVSPQAKANIFQVITDRYNVAKSQYDNFAKQKQAQAESVAPGYKLTDYASGFNTNNTPLPPASTPSEKSAALDTVVGKSEISTPSITTNPDGWFSNFLHIFGL